MGILGKLFGEKAPEWAQPISPQLYKEFQRDVNRVLQESAPGMVVDWDEGVSSSPDLPLRIGFHNLIRSWLNEEPQRRFEVAQNFIDSLLNFRSQPEPTVDQNSHQLRPRIVDREELNGLPEVAFKSFGENLFSLLAFDQGTLMRFLSIRDLEDSGKGFEELLALAVENLSHDPEPETMHKASSLGTLSVIGDECFGAAQMFLLGKFTEPDRTYLVTAPSRATMLLFEPQELSFEAVSWFLNFATHAYLNISEYRILPFIHKYRNGVFEDITELRDGQVVLRVNAL